MCCPKVASPPVRLQSKPVSTPVEVFGLTKGVQILFYSFKSFVDTVPLFVEQGVLMFKDQFRAVMQYSLPRDVRSGEATKILNDWVCLKVTEM